VVANLEGKLPPPNSGAISKRGEAVFSLVFLPIGGASSRNGTECACV
jgi:hypothetical protein